MSASEETRLPLDAYGSEETLLATWQQTQQAKKLRERNRILVEADRVVSARAWSDWVSPGSRGVLLDPPSLVELKAKVETRSLRQVKEQLAEVDEQIAEYKAYEQRVTEKLRHDAEVTHEAYRLTTEERFDELLDHSDWKRHFALIAQAIQLVEEIRNVYAARLVQLEKQASPERLKKLMERVCAICREAEKLRRQIQKALESPGCKHNYERVAKLLRGFFDLRSEYSCARDDYIMVSVDAGAALPEFPSFNENLELPVEVRRLLKI